MTFAEGMTFDVKSNFSTHKQQSEKKNPNEILAERAHLEGLKLTAHS